MRDLLKKLLNGRYRGEELTLIKNAFEAVGEYNAGKISQHELASLQLEACPGAGACQGLGIIDGWKIFKGNQGELHRACFT